MIDHRILWISWFGVMAGVMVVLSAPPQLSAQMAVGPVSGASVVSTGGVSKGGGRVEIARSGDGLFYIDGRINGASVRFLIDTGSSAVVLTPQDAARAGATIDPNRDGAMIQTANGSAAMAWTTARRVVVAGRTVDAIDAAVPASGLKVSLLGQELLQKLGPLTIDGDRLIIHADRKAPASFDRLDQPALESADLES